VSLLFVTEVLQTVQTSLNPKTLGPAGTQDTLYEQLTEQTESPTVAKEKGQPGEGLPLVRPQGRDGPQLPGLDYGR
jgi:hypothetical protein